MFTWFSGQMEPANPYTIFSPAMNPVGTNNFLPFSVIILDNHEYYIIRNQCFLFLKQDGGSYMEILIAFLIAFS